MNRRGSSRFIMNKGLKSLRERIGELISLSKELKFLVGFFYFSGIKELYESLKNNTDVKNKVLVGLEVDTLLHRLVEHGNFDSGSTDEVKNQKLFYFNEEGIYFWGIW